MKYGLGIDTGGTYTDAVIYDFESMKIVSTAKSITVKEDLRVGINMAIEGLPAEAVAKVKLVSLSTTLATNACVEGKGSRAKLVLIGCYEQVVTSHGHEYGLPDASEIIFLEGGHNQHGEVISEPDWDFLKTKVETCRHDVDAFAVVQLWGTRNNEFEKKAKDLLIGWTGLQVICGHELTGELNSLKRAASALLNAKLIPIIQDFLSAIKKSLKHHGIKAPLVIVRGDGSLMSEAFSRDKPIETLLCGPAASVAGGIYLSGEKNCIVVDMGGTTSDLAIVRNGAPKLAAEGANVGKWRTGIKSIQIDTVGLGGDSLIRHNSKNRLTIGPVRAAPLSWAASRWPELLGKIRKIHEEKKKHTVSLCEFFYLVKDIAGDSFYNARETAIAAALQNGPLSITELAASQHISIYELNTKRLEQYGVIMRCGLTPTDIMHLTGDFTGWSGEAARYGAMILADQINYSLDNLTKMVHEDLLESLYSTIIKMLMEDDDERLQKDGISRQLGHLVSSSFRKKRKEQENQAQDPRFMTCSFTTDATLVGIGAPIHIYLPDVARLMNARCVIPEYAAVANAIGAITSNVVSEASIIIRPQNEAAGITTFIAFSATGNRVFLKHSDSIVWAKAEVEEMARASALAKGADHVEISVTAVDNEVDISGYYLEMKENDASASSAASEPNAEKTGNLLFLESVVTARAVGKVKWV